MQTKRPNPSASANAQAALASVNAAIFSAIICQHSSAPSGPPRVIFKRRIMITPFASKLNSAASILDFQNNTSLLLDREKIMKFAALGSARDAAGRRSGARPNPPQGAAIVLRCNHQRMRRSPRAVCRHARKAAPATRGQRTSYSAASACWLIADLAISVSASSVASSSSSVSSSNSTASSKPSSSAQAFNVP